MAAIALGSISGSGAGSVGTKTSPVLDITAGSAADVLREKRMVIAPGREEVFGTITPPPGAVTPSRSPPGVWARSGCGASARALASVLPTSASSAAIVCTRARAPARVPHSQPRDAPR